MSLPIEVDIAIVGAGIGGLAAAVALKQQNRDVHVFEKAPALGEVGGAIIMRMGSAELLDSWGALQDYRSVAVPLTRIEFRDEHGDHQGESGFPVRPGEASSTYGIHRADLHGLLQRRVPAERLHLGAALAEVLDHDDHAELRFTDGTAVRANVVVGADGIRSTVRGTRVGGAPVYAGLVISRGVVPVEHLPEGLPNDCMRMWSKDNRTIMAIPMRGGREFAIDTVHFAEDPPADLWTATVGADELLADFADFAPEVTDMVRASRTPLHLQGVHELDPFTGWSTGRITLLGDAAHAMNPSHGQGANNAIQDAGALARHIDGVPADGIPAALAAYAAEREPATKEIQLASRVRPSTPGLAA